MATNKFQKRIMKLKGFWNLFYSLFLLRYTSWNNRFLQSDIKALSIERLHVGCGNILLKGWLNIRYDLREEYGKVKQLPDGACYLNFNLLKIWPIVDESIQYISGSHFIEHLDLNQGIEFLREAFRVLKKRRRCPFKLSGFAYLCPKLYRR